MMPQYSLLPVTPLKGREDFSVHGQTTIQFLRNHTHLRGWYTVMVNAPSTDLIEQAIDMLVLTRSLKGKLPRFHLLAEAIQVMTIELGKEDGALRIEKFIDMFHEQKRDGAYDVSDMLCLEKLDGHEISIRILTSTSGLGDVEIAYDLQGITGNAWFGLQLPYAEIALLPRILAGYDPDADWQKEDVIGTGETLFYVKVPPGWIEQENVNA